MRYRIVYLFLLLLKLVSRTFYRFDWRWVGDVPEYPWDKSHRLVAILNHTSLYEVLFAGGVPNRFLWRMARHGVVPVAAKTIERPLIGWLFRTVAANVVPITRHRDHTWEQVVRSLDDPDAMIIILPEGRMKRATGLDLNGKPMSVRGGIADLMAAMDEGDMLFAYSEGLHHVQAPGEKMPRLFKNIRLRLESAPLEGYREARCA